jgi:hypothetical protein
VTELPQHIRELNERLKRNPELTANLGPVHMLSVPGRTSAAMRTTPVSPYEYDGQRLLVAGFGAADWVKNLRVAGWCILTKGTRSERVSVVEMSESDRPPVLKVYLQWVNSNARYAFDVDPDAPVEEFASIAAEHPIFRIVEAIPVEQGT